MSQEKKNQRAGKSNLSEVEKGQIKVLLELKLYSTAEIGEKVGRSADVVAKVAHKFGIVPLGQSKRSEEYKLRVADMWGNQTERMLKSIDRMTDEELDKFSLAQRSLSAGIATDKLIALTKKEELPAGSVTVNISWVDMVRRLTPGRIKDGTIEEAEIVSKKVEDITK